MNKFRATYLGAFILGWLLCLGSHVAWGYYPPLQATGSYSTNKITYTVYNPQKQLGYTGSLGFPPTITVVDMKQHNGVIAWVLRHDDGTYSLQCITFDPWLDTFKRDGWGPFTSVSQLKVTDGVVAHIASLPTGNTVIGYTTYDPDKGTWISGQTERTNVYSFQHFLVKEGVVAWVAEEGGGTLVQHAIRDPRASSWNVDGALFVSGGGVDYFAITNATVYWDRASISWFMGYKAVENPTGSYYGGWDAFKITKPFAYFVAQPNIGKKPLWVWFTDMSIAGANWSWDFGDSTSPSSDRSPYHTFASTGSFQVTQGISGPSTYSQTVTVLTTYILEGGKSVPAMLHLLLLSD
jgi:PKD repeat protein